MGERGKKMGQIVKENFEFTANLDMASFLGRKKNSTGGYFSEILYQWY